MINIAEVCRKLSVLACTLDSNGYFTGVSELFTVILGYSESMVVGKHFAEFVSADDLARSREAWGSLKAGNPLHHFRNYYVTARGELICIEWNAAYDLQEASCYCAGQVITGDLNDDADLGEHELYRRMFVENPSAMFIYEPSTLKFVMVNNAACEQYGYSREEFDRINVIDIIPPHRREHYQIHLSYYLEQTRMKHEDQHQHKNGKLIDVVVYAESFRFRKRQCRLVTALDVTEKKSHEERLRLFETVLTNVTDGVMITEPVVAPDCTPKILYVNPAFEKQSGYTSAELTGACPEVLYGPETDIQAIKQMMRALSLAEHFIGQFAYYKKQGENFHVGLNIAPVKDADGKVINYIWVTRDLTELRQAEYRQKKLMDELVMSSSHLNQFSYIASHNLRAPLTNIMAIAKLMESGVTAAELERLVRLIKRSSQQLNETIEDLVNILLIKESTVNKDLVDLETLWNHVRSGNKEGLEAAGAIITANFDKRWVRFNKVYLASILQELLSNAIKFRRPGVPLQVNLSSVRTKDGVSILFSDNGMGLDLQVAGDKLFGLYQRFHPGTPGKGLGLFMVRSQLQAMDAVIRVKTAPGQGFHLTIDLAAE